MNVLKTWVALVVWLLCGSAAHGDLFVDPLGSDANDCSSPSTPCATIQGAVDKVRFATTADIFLASGIFAISAPINVYYWRLIAIRGPRNTDGSCKEPVPTVRATAGGNVFWAQDSAILAVVCIKIQGNGSEPAVGLAARQNAIIDFGPGIHFDSLDQYIDVQDGAKASCTGKIYLDSTATVGFGARKGSLLNLGFQWSLESL